MNHERDFFLVVYIDSKHISGESLRFCFACFSFSSVYIMIEIPKNFLVKHKDLTWVCLALHDVPVVEQWQNRSRI